MAQVHLAQNNLTAGQLDPALHERYEYQGYSSGLAVLDDYLVMPQGGATRRPGTRYVATAYEPTATRLIPFVLSQTVAYVLELGPGYIRPFLNNALVAGVVIGTPYTAADLALLHYTTFDSTMVFTHPSYPTAELVRHSATSWTYRAIAFAPPPSFEHGRLPESGLVLGSISGVNVAAGAIAGTFTPSDIDRVIALDPTLGSGRGVITEVTDTANVLVDITVTFPSTTIDPGMWRILGSPSAILTVSKVGPVGASVTLIPQLDQPSNSELITDGDFPDLANWSNFSGRDVAFGEAGATSLDELLVSTTSDFLDTGVRAGYRALNTTAGNEDVVASVGGVNILRTPVDGGVIWTAGDTYNIKMTGVAYVPFPGRANLDGGRQGRAHIEQAITTTVGQTYQLTFDVSEAPLSLMIGDSTDMSNVLAEFTYQPGNNQHIVFTAVDTTTVIAFRNNQNAISGLSNVSVKRYDVAVFSAADAGKYVVVNSGIIQLTGLLGTTQATGVILKELDDLLPALPGAWTLEESQWTATLGYPRTLTFQGNRLHVAGSTAYPNRLWGSRVGIFNDFSRGSNADDSYQYDLSATEVNQIQWIVGERALLVGTDRNELTVRGELGHSITPLSVDVSNPSNIGVKPIQPIRSPNSLLFVPRSGRRVYENTGTEDFTADDRQLQDRSIVAEGLTRSGIRSLAYQQEPRPIVWVVTVDGRLLALTYLREQIVAGWAPQSTVGTVLSVSVIPHPDGDRDQVWILVQRNGNSPFIEYLDDASGYYSQLMVDSGVTFNSISPLTSFAAAHLEGLTVDILGDGIQQFQRVVTAGVVAIDPPAYNVEIGLPFQPLLTTLRPTYLNIPLSGLKLSNVRITVTFLNSLNAVVNDERINFGTASTALDTPQPLYSGPKEIEAVGWDNDARVTIVQDAPYPITILNITRYLEIEDYQDSRGGNSGT